MFFFFHLWSPEKDVAVPEKRYAHAVFAVTPIGEMHSATPFLEPVDVVAPFPAFLRTLERSGGLWCGFFKGTLCENAWRSLWEKCIFAYKS